MRHASPTSFEARRADTLRPTVGDVPAMRIPARASIRYRVPRTINASVLRTSALRFWSRQPRPDGRGYCLTAPSGLGLIRGQRNADHFSVISREDTTVGKRGVAPDDISAEAHAGRLQHVPAADLFIPAGTEVGYDQVAHLVGHKEPVAVLDQEGRRRVGP